MVNAPKKLDDALEVEIHTAKAPADHRPAPKGVYGRNCDNTLIQKNFHREPSTRLRLGMELTYRLIYDQMMEVTASLNAP